MSYYNTPVAPRAGLTLGVTGFFLSGLRHHLVLPYCRRSAADPIFQGLAWLGAFSYSTFPLRHVPVIMGLQGPRETVSGSPSLLAWVALIYIASLVVGVVMSKLVDYPVLRIRDRFFPSRSGTLQAMRLESR